MYETAEQAANDAVARFKFVFIDAEISTGERRYLAEWIKELARGMWIDGHKAGLRDMQQGWEVEMQKRATK
jgi:fatty acid-binding protein DegV